MRADGRDVDQLRPTSFVRDYTEAPLGSTLVTAGRTRVLCTASVEDRVPAWMRGGGKGWVTAEYSMLPGSTVERTAREAARGRQSGRTQEIQRLIGRSLRSICDMTVLGELQVVVDCDVLQADGGTRTASICGAYVALHDALTRLVQQGRCVEDRDRDMAPKPAPRHLVQLAVQLREQAIHRVLLAAVGALDQLGDRSGLGGGEGSDHGGAICGPMSGLRHILRIAE